MTLKAGFPHSEICGSKRVCSLPAAYRKLLRPSSPVYRQGIHHVHLFTCPYNVELLLRESLSHYKVYSEYCLAFAVSKVSICISFETWITLLHFVRYNHNPLDCSSRTVLLKTCPNKHITIFIFTSSKLLKNEQLLDH